MIIKLIIATRRKKKIELSKEQKDAIDKIEMQEIFSEQAYFD